MSPSPSYLNVQPRQPSDKVLRPESVQEWRFRGVEFRAPLNLQGLKFDRGVIFSRCVFREQVSFEGAHFGGTARFYKCIFHAPVSFKWAAVELSEKAPADACDNGEANFSWSRFEDEVIFYGARFHGPAIFWRTMFRHAAKFEAARFDAAVTFEASPAQVCLEALDFADKRVFVELHKAGVLWQDEDDSRCANMPGIGSTGELRKRLVERGWTPDNIEQATAAYSVWSGDMFSEKGASFRGTWFEKPDQVRLSNVKLETCQFSNSNAGRVKFQNVHWDRQPTLLWASGRNAVCDEKAATSAEDLRAVARLYYDLRTNYEANRSFEEASDFSYGEAEMQRRCQSRLLRYISLPAIYRYLSAYGERPGLALSWLIAAIFLFFPLLYILAGYNHQISRSVLHSLEISAFLESSKDSAVSPGEIVPITAKFVAGFERMAVSVQAGIFALAVQRKFSRK
jgi:uncharacterized protein YjbI with pentapeptide repeats